MDVALKISMWTVQRGTLSGFSVLLMTSQNKHDSLCSDFIPLKTSRKQHSFSSDSAAFPPVRVCDSDLKVHLWQWFLVSILSDLLPLSCNNKMTTVQHFHASGVSVPPVMAALLLWKAARPPASPPSVAAQQIHVLCSQS